MIAAADDQVAREELLASVASMYYLDGLDQHTIASRIGSSRSTVSRLITEARASGVVTMRIERPLPRDGELEQQVADGFGLRSALVVADPFEGVSTPTAVRVGRLGARHLEERLPRNGVLAISWGEAVGEVAAALTDDPSRRVRVVQMIGASGTPRPEIDGPELARTFARRLGGDYRVLSAPLVVDDAEVAKALLRQQSVAQVLDEAARADVAIIGLGGIDPEVSSLLRVGYASREDLARSQAQGVVGDAAGHMLDAGGGAVVTELSERMVRLGEDSIRAIPEVVAVAQGPAKVSVIRAALRSGLIDVLVTDAATARAVLELDARSGGSGVTP